MSEHAKVLGDGGDELAGHRQPDLPARPTREGLIGSPLDRAMDEPRTPALLGGKPAFPELVHVGRPNIPDRARVLERIGEALDRRWLSNQGPLVQAFEAELATRLRVKHVLAVCNATVGLQVAALAMGLKGEVIMPSFTFVATAHAMEAVGLVPVFADVDSRTHCLDPKDAAARIGPSTTAILGVHLWGRACDVGGLQSLANAHGLSLFFDAAHAFGSTWGGRPIGGFGRCEVFSFHATKFVNAFEGGAIATNDDGLAARVALIRNFGFADYDRVVCTGINGKLNEASAAMGLTSLESIQSVLEVNRGHLATYVERLQGLPGLQLLDFDPIEHHNWQYVVVQVEPPFPLSRDDLISYLHSENVLARRYFWPGCHAMEPYFSRDPDAERGLPHTKAVASRICVLPTGTGVSTTDVMRIANMIRAAAEPAFAEQIRAALATRSGNGRL